ncbi:MAG: hypothetical protein EPO32_05105 [Anaerolineae bacterium]|nr:MAG: hypothetical protein EPO32_05105 [Anaerolineae bacterium]
MLTHTNKQNPTMRRLFGTRLDGVVTAAHFGRGGRILWVRAYERRGPTWSDHVLLDRDQLVQRLEAGKRFYTGTRVKFQASEFELEKVVNLRDGDIVTEGAKGNGDRLEGVGAL